MSSWCMRCARIVTRGLYLSLKFFCFIRLDYCALSVFLDDLNAVFAGDQGFTCNYWPQRTKRFV